MNREEVRATVLSGDQQALVVRARPMVKAIARALIGGGIGAHMLDDLEACGYLGAIEAAQTYRFDAETPFEGYAWRRIIGSMLDALAKERVRVSPRQAEALQKAIAALGAVAEYAEQIRDSGDDDLDEEMGGAATAGSVMLLCAGSSPVSPEAVVFVVQALSYLAERERALVRWHVFEELTFEEIAERTGTHERTVRKRYHDAVKRLAAVLGSLRARN